MTDKITIERETLEDAYRQGWRAAASWANRDDLLSDINSSAYENERDARLRNLRAALAAQPADAQFEADLIESVGQMKRGEVARVWPAPAAVPTDERIEKALRRAFSLGQTYWQQADSDYTSEHKKSDVTRERFEALVAETIAAGDKP